MLLLWRVGYADTGMGNGIALVLWSVESTDTGRGTIPQLKWPMGVKARTQDIYNFLQLIHT